MSIHEVQNHKLKSYGYCVTVFSRMYVYIQVGNTLNQGVRGTRIDIKHTIISILTYFHIMKKHRRSGTKAVYSAAQKNAPQHFPLF